MNGPARFIAAIEPLRDGRFSLRDEWLGAGRGT
jgi:hypothetical protein